MKRLFHRSFGWLRVANHRSAARGLLLSGVLGLGAALVSPATADTNIGIGVTAVLGDPSSRLVPTPPPNPDQLVPVPADGLDIRLWSAPGSGSIVHPGDLARLYFRTNADCYVTVFSVDTEGRVRLLFPNAREDGWVEGRRTWSVPRRGAGYDLRFAGPPGLEYVYAVASYAPMYDRYPYWLVEGRVLDPEDWWWESDCEVWETGLVVGDPFYRMRAFCEHLVPNPQRTDTYASSFVYFQLGRRVEYPRYLCSDCHWGGWIDPYGPACSAVRVQVGPARCAGWLDLRFVYRPVFTYEVSRHWRARHEPGHRWEGPDGRWVCSSADFRHGAREHFREARDLGRVVRHEGREDRPGGGDDRHGWDRDRKPERPDERDGWTRSHLDRIQRSLDESRGADRAGEVRPSKEERPGGKEVRPSSPDRSSRSEGKDRGESRQPKREGKKSSERSKSEDRGRSGGDRGSGRMR